MRRALTLVSALALMLAASTANRVKIETRELERRVGRLTEEVRQRRAAVATLNAEWAYLNRPERLLRLASAFGDELELKPRRPDSFARMDEIPIPGGRLTARAPTPLDLSDLDAPIMGSLEPQPAGAAAVVEEAAAPLFPDYEEVVTAPEFVGEEMEGDWAAGYDPYAAALVESQPLAPPARFGAEAQPQGAAPVAAPAMAPVGPPPASFGFAPQAPALPAGYAAPPVAPAQASGYALPPGAVVVPAQGMGLAPAAYPSAPAGFAVAAPYNGAAQAVGPAPIPMAAAPQPVFAPDTAPPPRIEIWEPLP